MQPGLALAYNSSAKSGWVGVGWDLQGIGSIQRDTKWGLNYNGDDYVFNSSELVYKGTTPAGEREYQAKIEGSFLRYLKYSDGKWVVTDKSGTAYTFGDSSATRQEHPSGGVFKWMLSRVQDTHGNSMTFSYLKDQGEIYIDRIDWTGGSVKFYWEARPDVPKMYTANYEVKTAWRLKTVDVTAYGQRVRAYALKYHPSAGTKQSLLESVRQYGADATVDASGTVAGVTLLPPVSVTWQEAPESATFDFRWICQDVCGPLAEDQALLGDFNGDGRTDIFFHPRWSTASQVVRLSNGDGTFDYRVLCEDNCGFADDQVLPGDFNGDGKTDLIFYNSGTGAQALRLSNGDGTFSFGWVCQYDCNLGGYTALPGDFNGDGRTDLFFYDRGTGTQVVKLSNGDGTFDRVDVCPANCNASGYTLVVGDFNGDGNSDILFYDYGGGSYLAKLSNGDGTFSGAWICQDNCNMSGYTPALGDFNRDGYTDIFFYNRGTGEQVVRLSNGDGTFGSIGVCLTNCNAASFNTILSGDFNGDGRTDIILHNSSTQELRLALSNGDGTFDYRSPCLSNCGTNGGIQVGDFNGDGKTDIFFHRKSPASYALRLNQGLYPDLVSAIGNSLGGTQTITYKPSSAYSNTLLPFIVQTVSSVTAYGGLGTTLTTNYTYSGGFYSFAEREFRGFQYSKATDLTGAYTETWYHQDDQKKWLVWHADAFAGTLISKTSYTYAVSTPVAGVTRRDLGTTYAETYDGGSTSKTLYTGYSYDTYGNVQTMTVSDPASGTITARTTYTDFVYNPSAYIVNRPSHTTSTIGGIKVSEAWFDYDGQANGVAPTKGDLTRQTSWLSGGTNPVVQHFYDSYGNRIGTIDAKGSVCSSTGYTTKTDYDSTYQTYPVTVTDALCRQAASTYWGINTSLSAGSVSGAYAVSGLLATVTDPNGVRTDSYYDALGRARATVVPPDTASAPTTVTSYTITGTAPSSTLASKRESVGGGTLDSVTYVDGLERTIQAKSEAETAGQWITVDTGYDERGLANRATVPYLRGTSAYTGFDYWQPMTVTIYDAMRRPTRVTNSDGTYRTTSYYQWVVTVTDEKGATTTSTSDALGRLISVQEPSGGGTTTYTYDIVDASGNVTSQITDAAGNIFKTTLDTLGRKKSQIDPDLGTWSYTYDQNGNLLTQTDAKGQTITLAYDKLNRLTTKTYPDAKQIAYTYDTGCTYCVGRLRQVTDLTGSTAFTYDQRGRGTQVDKTLSGGEPTWTIQNVENNPYLNYTAASIAVDGQGAPHIAYFGSGNLKYAKWTGSSWDIQTVATSIYWTLSLALDGSGTPHIAYQAGSLKYARWNGSAWTIETVDSTTGESYYSPSIKVDSQGNIHVAYSAQTASSSYLKYAKRTASGWTLQAVDNPGTGYVGSYTSLALDTSGNPHISYRDGNANALKYAKWTGTAWSIQGIPNEVGGYSTSIAVDSQGRPHISHWGQHPWVWGYTGVRYARWDGSAWVTQNVDPNGGSGQTSLALDSAGNPHIGYCADVPKYAKLVGASWSIQTVDSATSWSCSTLSMALDSGANPHFGYYNVPNAADRLLRYAKFAPPASATYTTQSTYDSLDRVVDVTYPDGEVVHHTYNTQGFLDKLSSVTNSMDYLSNLNYNALGKITAKTVGNNLATTYTYDPLNFRLTGLSTSGSLQNLTYGYDNVGNITGITDTVKAGTQIFGYDLLDRLASASSAASPTYSYTYTYSPIGNMLAGAGKTFTYPAAGSARPHAPTSDGSCSYSYDLNGNLASRTCGTTTRAFTWDYDNRLTKAAEGSTTLAEFTYDYAGARVKKVEGSTTTVYPFAHYRVKSGAVTKYYFANGRVAERDSTGVYYYHPDHLGSSNVVTDSSGIEVKATLFYPYGGTRTETGTKEIIHKYTGQEQDSSTGLYNYGARYYDPAFMHFISADSIIPNSADPQSLNHYAYVRNNPIRLIDPTGHAPVVAQLDPGLGGGDFIAPGVLRPSPYAIPWTKAEADHLDKTIGKTMWLLANIVPMIKGGMLAEKGAVWAVSRAVGRELTTESGIGLIVGNTAGSAYLSAHSQLAMRGEISGGELVYDAVTGGATAPLLKVGQKYGGNWLKPYLGETLGRRTGQTIVGSMYEIPNTYIRARSFGADPEDAGLAVLGGRLTTVGVVFSGAYDNSLIFGRGLNKSIKNFINIGSASGGYDYPFPGTEIGFLFGAFRGLENKWDQTWNMYGYDAYTGMGGSSGWNSGGSGGGSSSGAQYDSEGVDFD